jgi:glycerol-1-phosphatase
MSFLNCPQPLMLKYDTALLDLDGVVYIGSSEVPGAKVHLAAARKAGLRLAFVTNNASRPPAAVADHLNKLGIPATPNDVVTSAQASARLVASLVPPNSAVLVVGGLGVEQALIERGLMPVFSADDEPRAVVQGFDPAVDWAMLTEGALAVARGAVWVASNRDLTVPLPRGQAPGNGALVEVIRLATGKEPLVAGKPEPPLHAEAITRTGARRPLVVGDRLDTDIEGAVRAQTDSLLVMSGVTRPADLISAPEKSRPSYVSEDLQGLLRPQSQPERDGLSWRCGAARVYLDSDNVVILKTSDKNSDRCDALKALCALIWDAKLAISDPTAILHEMGW